MLIAVVSPYFIPWLLMEMLLHNCVKVVFKEEFKQLLLMFKQSRNEDTKLEN